MICYLKFIFVCISLIPQPTGYVYIWDYIFLICTAIFSVYLLLSQQNSIVSSYDALYLDDFFISPIRQQKIVVPFRIYKVF